MGTSPGSAGCMVVKTMTVLVAGFALQRQQRTVFRRAPVFAYREVVQRRGSGVHCGLHLSRRGKGVITKEKLVARRHVERDLDVLIAHLRLGTGHEFPVTVAPGKVRSVQIADAAPRLHDAKRHRLRLV